MAHNLGPLEALLNDSAITAIHMTADKIEYHKNGQSHLSDSTFASESDFRGVVMSILDMANQSLSADNSPVSCVLSDGTQVHATYSPLSLSLTKAN